MTKTELCVIKYLESTYGQSGVSELGDRICVNGVGIYFKKHKEVGFVGAVHKDLCNWFGYGKYHPVMKKWFCEKYGLEIIW